MAPLCFYNMRSYRHTTCKSMHTTAQIPTWDVHNGANLMLDLGLKPWYGRCQLYPSGFSTMKPHWLMWKPMLTTLLILRMDFHNDAKSELRIGYWKLSFCQGLYSWYGWYQWYPASDFSTVNAHWLMWKPCIPLFHNDAKFELDIENYLPWGIITMVWAVPKVPFWLFFYESSLTYSEVSKETARGVSIYLLHTTSV